MIVMTALAFAVFQGETAECEIRIAVEQQAVTRVGLTCPSAVTDAAGLQAYADQVAAAFQTPLDLPPLQVIGVSSTVNFTGSGQGWSLREPALFLSSAPDYPERAARRGVEARCDLRIQVSAGGAAGEIEAVCQSFRPNGAAVRQSGFEDAAVEAASRHRWFAPLDPERRCALDSFTFELGDGEGDRPHLERPVAEAPQCP